jgi:4,5-dihydroxyphthalate decarboxylase
MSKLRLSIAIGDYDHTREVISGRVGVEGVDLISSLLPAEEVFHRFSRHREWDLSEMSMGRYSAMRSQGDDSVIALPVFLSRVFRHSMFYVREGSGMTRLADLAGKRIGIPEWAQTAGVYGRGLLMHEAGLAIEDIAWVQAGVNDPGREEMVKLTLPPSINLVRLRDKTLNGMLLAGEIDAAMTARPPAALGQGVVRLIGNAQAEERDYYRRTGIYPIMHVLTMRAEVFRQHPWVAMNLLKAFEQAKQRSIARLLDITAAAAPLPWLVQFAQETADLFGPDFWPYGVEPNRRTLENFLRFAHEQSVCARLLAPEELFPPNTASSVKV